MATFWLTFRLEYDPSYDKRYQTLIDYITSISNDWWGESSSFMLFSAEMSIDTLAAEIKSRINPKVDVALIGMPDFKSARILGASQDADLFKLMPFTKKA